MFDDILGSLFGVGAFTPQPTPYPWDPSTEQFWQQVRANQEAAAQGRTSERIQLYGLPPPKEVAPIMSAYNGAPITEKAPDEFPTDATDVPAADRNDKELQSPEDESPYPFSVNADRFIADSKRVPYDGPNKLGDVQNMYDPRLEAPGGKVRTVGKPRTLSLSEELRISQAVPAPGGLPNFSGPPRQVGKTWTSDPRWRVGLTDTQKAAAMALMEADTRNGKPDLEAAKNALGAMINRAQKTGVKLGEHVSRSIYQPTIEPGQWKRLNRLIRLPEFQQLTQLAEARVKGTIGDWVQGATHFLAHEKTMLALSGGVRPDPYNPGQFVGNSRKYFSWPKWTGFDPSTGSYRGVVFRDKSHAFLKLH